MLHLQNVFVSPCGCINTRTYIKKFPTFSDTSSFFSKYVNCSCCRTSSKNCCITSICSCVDDRSKCQNSWQCKVMPCSNKYSIQQIKSGKWQADREKKRKKLKKLRENNFFNQNSLCKFTGLKNFNFGCFLPIALWYPKVSMVLVSSYLISTETLSKVICSKQRFCCIFTFQNSKKSFLWLNINQ